MLCHVSLKNSLYNDMANAFEISTSHFDLPVAALILSHELEGRGQVMVLQHAYIIMPNCYLIICSDQEGIGDAGVLKIVQGSTDVATHLLQVVQLNFIFDTTIHCKVVECLADISGVRLVVICYTLVAC